MSTGGVDGDVVRPRRAPDAPGHEAGGVGGRLRGVQRDLQPRDGLPHTGGVGPRAPLPGLHVPPPAVHLGHRTRPAAAAGTYVPVCGDPKMK